MHLSCPIERAGILPLTRRITMPTIQGAGWRHGGIARYLIINFAKKGLICSWSLSDCPNYNNHVTICAFYLIHDMPRKNRERERERCDIFLHVRLGALAFDMGILFWTIDAQNNCILYGSKGVHGTCTSDDFMHWACARTVYKIRLRSAQCVRIRHWAALTFSVPMLSALIS